MAERRVVKALVQVMETSRKDDTKFEYFASLQNSDGKYMTMYMFHYPIRALYQAIEMAKFMGIPCDPFIIDGKEVELDAVSKLMLED